MKQNSELLYSISYAHYEQGNYPKAISLFSQLVTEDPSEERFWRGLASARQMAGLYEEATYAWGFAAVLANNDPLPHFHAAECLITVGKNGDAKRALEMADERCGSDSEQLKQRIATLREVVND